MIQILMIGGFLSFRHGGLDELWETALLVFLLFDDQQTLHALMVLDSCDSLFYFALQTTGADVSHRSSGSNSILLTIALLV